MQILCILYICDVRGHTNFNQVDLLSTPYTVGQWHAKVGFQPTNKCLTCSIKIKGEFQTRQQVTDICFTKQKRNIAMIDIAKIIARIKWEAWLKF